MRGLQDAKPAHSDRDRRLRVRLEENRVTAADHGIKAPSRTAPGLASSGPGREAEPIRVLRGEKRVHRDRDRRPPVQAVDDQAIATNVQAARFVAADRIADKAEAEDPGPNRVAQVEAAAEELRSKIRRGGAAHTGSPARGAVRAVGATRSA